MVGERPKPFGEALGFDPMTSTLIFGEYDAVLVDAMTTVAEAEALANWVALHNRNLETIYITHAHFDHFYGLSVLLDRFPNARAIATPKTLNAMQMSFTPPVERLARRLFPGNWPLNSLRLSPMSARRSPSRARNCASSSRATPIVPIRRLYTFHRSA
jgi:glyoxylase-like metal-dependent hydrolase (beta-lactamase superfamily II)